MFFLRMILQLFSWMLFFAWLIFFNAFLLFRILFLFLTNFSLPFEWLLPSFVLWTAKTIQYVLIILFHISQNIYDGLVGLVWKVRSSNWYIFVCFLRLLLYDERSFSVGLRRRLDVFGSRGWPSNLILVVL